MPGEISRPVTIISRQNNRNAGRIASEAPLDLTLGVLRVTPEDLGRGRRGMGDGHFRAAVQTAATALEGLL